MRCDFASVYGNTLSEFFSVDYRGITGYTFKGGGKMVGIAEIELVGYFSYREKRICQHHFCKRNLFLENVLIRDVYKRQGEYILSDGDVVEWAYSCNLGEDVK